MKIHLFDLKALMEVNGESIIDFTTNNFDVDYNSKDFRINKILLVRDYQVGRIDVIAYETTGSQDNVDIILKTNQITNPFSINEGDLILIPNIESAKNFYKSIEKNERNVLDTKSLYIDASKSSKKDIARLEQLSKIADKRKNGSKEIKPTNLLRDGEVPFTVEPGIVILSPNISR